MKPVFSISNRTRCCCTEYGTCSYPSVWVNVRNPRMVKELIHKNVEAAKDSRRMRATELLGGDDGPVYHEETGEPDFDEDDDME